VSALTFEGLRDAVLQAGLEIYRATPSEIVIAERVRMHLMDSGVAVAVFDPERAAVGARSALSVTLTVRGQRSDFPEAAPDELFERVRRAVLPATNPRGFAEVANATREVTDPVDHEHVLDVWHELTFAKNVDAIEALIEDVRWALTLPKCIDP